MRRTMASRLHSIKKAGHHQISNKMPVAEKIFYPGQWGDRNEATSHIHSRSHPFYLTAVKKVIHVSLHSPIAAAIGVMADSSPISWGSSHFLSILKVLWKRLAWGIYSSARDAERRRACETHLHDPWDWLNPFHIPQFERKNRGNK